jgi:hypothetical protein
MVNAIGAGLMIALGVLIATGEMERITQQLSRIGFSGL